jgi:hypothetical protein
MKLDITLNPSGPNGTMTYSDETFQLQLNWDFGGGDCWYIIFIPSVEEWTNETGKPIADRMKMIEFIFEETIRRESKNGSIAQKKGYSGYSYKVNEKSFSIHEKKIPELNKTRRNVVRILLTLRRFFTKNSN